MPDFCCILLDEVTFDVAPMMDSALVHENIDMTEYVECVILLSCVMYNFAILFQ